MDPQYGAKLTIDGEVISDEAIVIRNGSGATAYVWSDEPTETFYREDGTPYEVKRDPGNEVVGRIVQVNDEKPGVLIGVNAEGQPTTWEIEQSDRPCRGCY